MSWDDIVGQERAVGLLRRDVASGRTAHAYLLSGAAGSAPLQAAVALAAALVCGTGGCGECEMCVRVFRHAHPDVEVIEPAGMQLLVDQVRDAMKTAWRRPVAGSRRVIVVDQADRMNPNAQNAFLKALEEPPASTVLILVAAYADALLPTVRSRCREVTFRPLAEVQVAGALVSDGVEPKLARRLARIGGTLERARGLAADPEAASRRRELATRVAGPTRDPGDALEGAEWLASQTRSVRDRVAEQQRAELEEMGDWMRETKRATEERTRREQRRAEQDALEASLDDVTSVLRDLLACIHSPEAPVLNDDLVSELRSRAKVLGEPRVPALLACLSDVEVARRRLRSNANVLLTLEAMFLGVHQRLS